MITLHALQAESYSFGSRQVKDLILLQRLC